MALTVDIRTSPLHCAQVSFVTPQSQQRVGRLPVYGGGGGGSGVNACCRILVPFVLWLMGWLERLIMVILVRGSHEAVAVAVSCQHHNGL